MTGEVPEAILTAILTDASERTEVEVSALEVTRAQAMSWPDGSLGCPEPGMFYLQVITDGYWVEVVAGEERLDYRADTNGVFRLCTNPSGQPPLGTAPGDTINPTG